MKRLPKEVRKKEIRECAKKIFLEKGFKDTTMEDVVNASGMSKGGVYRHYKSTADMLHDLMVDAMDERFYDVGEFAKANPNLSKEDVFVEITILKILDKKDLKSLWAMLLIEAEKDERLREVRDRLLKESISEFLEHIEKIELGEMRCLVNEEIVAFINSMMVAIEVLSVRETFMNHKQMFRSFLKNYISENGKKGEENG